MNCLSFTQCQICQFKLSCSEEIQKQTYTFEVIVDLWISQKQTLYYRAQRHFRLYLVGLKINWIPAICKIVKSSSIYKILLFKFPKNVIFNLQRSYPLIYITISHLRFAKTLCCLPLQNYSCLLKIEVVLHFLTKLRLSSIFF